MRRAVLAGVLAAACASGGPRPVRPVVDDVIQAPIRVTRAAALQAVANIGLPLARSDMAAGPLETDFFDIASYRQEAGMYPANERFVRMQVSVVQDQQSSGSRVVVRALYNPFRSGVRDSRRGERDVPRGHPAVEIAAELYEELRRLAEGR